MFVCGTAFPRVE